MGDRLVLRSLGIAISLCICTTRWFVVVTTPFEALLQLLMLKY